MKKIKALASSYIQRLKETNNYDEMLKKCSYPLELQLEVNSYLSKFLLEKYENEIKKIDSLAENEWNEIMIKTASSFRAETADFTHVVFIKLHFMLKLTIEFGKNNNIDFEDFKKKIYFYTFKTGDKFWDKVRQSLMKKAKLISSFYPHDYEYEDIGMSCSKFTPGFSVESALNKYQSYLKELY